MICVDGTGLTLFDLAEDSRAPDAAHCQMAPGRRSIRARKARAVARGTCESFRGGITMIGSATGQDAQRSWSLRAHRRIGERRRLARLRGGRGARQEIEPVSLSRLAPEQHVIRIATASATGWCTVDCADEPGSQMFRLRAAVSLARLWRDQGRCGEARDLLAPLYGWFHRGLRHAGLEGNQSSARTFWDRFWDGVWKATNFARERIRHLARNASDLWNRAMTRMRGE